MITAIAGLILLAGGALVGLVVRDMWHHSQVRSITATRDAEVAHAERLAEIAHRRERAVLADLRHQASPLSSLPRQAAHWRTIYEPGETE